MDVVDDQTVCPCGCVEYCATCADCIACAEQEERCQLITMSDEDVIWHAKVHGVLFDHSTQLERTAVLNLVRALERRWEDILRTANSALFQVQEASKVFLSERDAIETERNAAVMAMRELRIRAEADAHRLDWLFENIVPWKTRKELDKDIEWSL